MRESKIVEMARKNRSLTLEVEKEKAEKARLVTELKAARACTGRAPRVLHAGAPNTDGTSRTESQIEKACREVVAEAAMAAEEASKARAEWRDKAWEASARAERDAGRYNTARAENDRLRAIIEREVGDDDVDFGELEKSLEAAGSWRARSWARRTTKRTSSRSGAMPRERAVRGRVRSARRDRIRALPPTTTSRRSARARRLQRQSSSARGAPATNGSSPRRRRWSCPSRR